MKSYKYLPIITGIFSATLLISNTLDNKIFELFGLALPAGIILFPLAYIFGDILTEVYGYASSRKVIWTGFFSLILMTACYMLAEALPAASFWKNQESFSLILGKVPRIVLASMVAYFAGEFVNSFTVAKIKVKSKGKNMSFRFILSTIFGQAVDTSVFVLIAFTGLMDVSSLLQITFSAWLFKVSWEIIALPLTLPVVKWLKKAETEDYYDVDTNFNPFIISKENE